MCQFDEFFKNLALLLDSLSIYLQILKNIIPSFGLTWLEFSSISLAWKCLKHTNIFRVSPSFVFVGRSQTANQLSRIFFFLAVGKLKKPFEPTRWHNLQRRAPILNSKFDFNTIFLLCLFLYSTWHETTELHQLTVENQKSHVWQ